MSEQVELPNGKISNPYEGYLAWKSRAENLEQAFEASQQEVEYYQTGIGLMQHHWISPQEYHEDFQKWQQENEGLTNQNAELRMALRVAHLPLPPSVREEQDPTSD